MYRTTGSDIGGFIDTTFQNKQGFFDDCSYPKDAMVDHYIGIADGSVSASPTGLYRHRRRLCIGIAGGSISASSTALYRHRRRHVDCAGKPCRCSKGERPRPRALPVVCSRIGKAFVRGLPRLVPGTSDTWRLYIGSTSAADRHRRRLCIGIADGVCGVHERAGYRSSIVLKAFRRCVAHASMDVWFV